MPDLLTRATTMLAKQPLPCRRGERRLSATIRVFPNAKACRGVAVFLSLRRTSLRSFANMLARDAARRDRPTEQLAGPVTSG